MRNPRRPVLLAVALAMVLPAEAASAEPATTAGREIPPSMFGLGGWRWPYSHEIQALSSRGLRSWRITLDWGGVESSRGSYGWSGYDNLLRRLTANRIEVMFTLTGCPRWACSSHGPPRTDAAKAAWHDFVRAAVRRYGAAGPVRYWQVMNEVNGNDQWPNPSPAGYAALLKTTAAVIRRTDAGSKVVLAGLPKKMTIDLGAYLPALYRQPGFTQDVDVIAVAGNGNGPRDTARVLRITRGIMRQFGDIAKPVWITEMGWGTGGVSHPYVTTERGQASKLRRAYDLLLACRRRWKLERVYWFAHSDRPNPPGRIDYWGNHNGLITTSGRWKPAMRWFLHYLRPRLPRGHRTTCRGAARAAVR